ncbi:MAG TPA: RusA family crossover junction endodeoxyribonuclease [Desulfobulbaceae bacterium]|jgi:Holliday junction resolvase RusA-like endonuclease|nr:RusA family crossover junction endodeoxyribonuclease [Desulfobulbaceae bacterium]
MNVYSFAVPGPPQGKLRARAARGIFYTPAKTKVYENLIRACFLGKYKHWPQIPACVPVSIQINAIFASPKREKRQGPVMKKPDVDNIAKVVLDAMNNFVFTDDAQVHSLSVSKSYGPDAGLVIRIYANVS